MLVCEMDVTSTCVSVFRLDFDYLNDLPVLILDVDDDFKNDRIKQEAIIDKVCTLPYLLCSNVYLLYLTSVWFLLQVREFLTTL